MAPGFLFDPQDKPRKKVENRGNKWKRFAIFAALA